MAVSKHAQDRKVGLGKRSPRKKKEKGASVGGTERRRQSVVFQLGGNFVVEDLGPVDLGSRQWQLSA